MTTLKEIEAQTEKYADARAALSAAVQEANDELEAIKRTHMSGIKRKLSIAAMHHQALSGLIEAAPHLFTKPRSVIVAGIRVGYQKGKGAITWDSDEQVVKLIRKHCADEFDALVKTVEAPVKAALAQKSAADLKRLGVTITDAGDEVLIKPADSHVDKLVAALLKSGRMPGNAAHRQPRQHDPATRRPHGRARPVRVGAALYEFRRGLQQKRR